MSLCMCACLFAQIEQEMELILNKDGLQRSFSTEWTQKWVSAIVAYSKGLKRRDVKELLKELDESLSHL